MVLGVTDVHHRRCDTEGHEIRHRIEFRTETRSRLQHPRHEAVCRIEQTAPDDEPCCKFEIADLGRDDGTQAEQETERGETVRYRIAQYVQIPYPA